MDYIVYFIITIGILVFIHEFGHFAAAKICNMRAEVFAIGFGKRLFGWNKISGFTFGDLPKDFNGEGNTDYRLCMLPLGGYVKISGMVDESFDTEFADEEPQPYEFRAKPTYQKLFVITAGVLMNLLLTLVIFWGMNFLQGKQVLLTTQIGNVADSSFAAQLGFQSGDKILEIDGTPVADWESTLKLLLVENLGKDSKVKVNRDNADTSIIVSGSVIAENSQKEVSIPIGNVQPAINEVIKDSPAMDAGIESGDVFLALNNQKLNSSAEAIAIISSNKEVELPLVILRGTDTVNTAVTPGMDGKIGISIGEKFTGPTEFRSYSFITSGEMSINNIGKYTVLTFTMLKNVIVGEIEFNQAFGGPVKIAKFAAKSADTGIASFLFFLAMLSLSLAIINILPFPVLDGGHFVIILIEGIIKKEIPIKIKIAIQNTGFVILLLLMAFIIYNDIISL